MTINFMEMSAKDNRGIYAFFIDICLKLKIQAKKKFLEFEKEELANKKRFVDSKVEKEELLQKSDKMAAALTNKREPDLLDEYEHLTNLEIEV